MKVLMIGNHENVHGGITSVIQQMLKFPWEKNNIKMKFIATYKNGNFIYKIGYFYYAILKIYSELAKKEIDCVHIHMSHTGSFYRASTIKKVCDFFKVPIVIHLHGSEFEKFYNNSSLKIQKKIEKFFSEIYLTIVLGEQWKNFIKKISPTANVQVLNNSIKIPDNIVKQEEKTVNFLFMGVLIQRKGIKDLLNAISLIDSNILNKYNVKFNIAGNGIEYEKLVSFTKEKKLEKKVNFLGWINNSEKDNLIKNNHVMILPSYNEGLPIAILEALSYGMPVIATDVGSIKEAVIDGENGYLFKPGDVDKLKEIIEKMILNFDKRKELGENARMIAKDNFNEERYYNKVLDIYLNINRGEEFGNCNNSNI